MKLETRNTKIRKLEDFQAWNEAITLAEKVYKATALFPKTEQYGLTSQVQRAVVSVSANLAEGFGRQHVKDKEHFYVMSRGSLYEVKSLLIIAKNLDLIRSDNEVWEQMEKCLRFIGALLRKHRGEL